MWRWTLIQWLDLKTCKFKLIVVELTQTGCLRLRWKEILKPKGQQHTKTDKALQRFIKTIDMKGFEMTNWNKIQKGGKEYLSAKGEKMEQRTRPCMLPYKLRGSVVILPDKNELVHTFRQQSSFSSLWAVTKGKYPAFTVHSIYSCREWKSNQELRGTSPHRPESSAGILDHIQGFVVCWLVIYFSASANNLSSPRNQMIYQQKLDF